MALLTMETLEEKLEEETNGNILDELAEELITISRALKGKPYKERRVKILANMSREVYEKTKFASGSLLKYLHKKFRPSSQKVLSSILLGQTMAIIFKEFAHSYSINPSISDIAYLGAITTFLSYTLHSIYQK